MEVDVTPKKSVCSERGNGWRQNPSERRGAERVQCEGLTPKKEGDECCPENRETGSLGSGSVFVHPHTEATTLPASH